MPVQNASAIGPGASLEAPRLALLIGGAGGLGEASCAALSAGRCRLAVADIDTAKAIEVAAAAGAEHRAYHVDATDSGSIAALFEAVEADMGPISILVYLAGGPFVDAANPTSVAETSLDTWDKAHRLNARGLFIATRAFFGCRRKRPVGHGRLITIGSMAGVAPSGVHTGISYAAAKAAAINLTRFAALEGGPLGITANSIAPATILTAPVLAGMSREQLDAIASQTPMGRIGRPENIASAVAYFASIDADFTTGVVLEVNGGRHMG